MRRIFWLAMGLGAGVTAAVMVSRWTRRQAERLAQKKDAATNCSASQPNVMPPIRKIRNFLFVWLVLGRENLGVKGGQ